MAVEPFPFATVEDLGKRWGGLIEEDHEVAKVHLEDASQFILDVAPSAAQASPVTRRRIVCQVVKRMMSADDEELSGMESVQMGTGPFQDTFKPVNPHGDPYLTKQEKKALGVGRQRAFSVNLLAGTDAATD